MAKINKDRKGTAEKKIKGSNKNIIGNKITKIKKTSLQKDSLKYPKIKAKKETTDRYKKKDEVDTDKNKKYLPKGNFEKRPFDKKVSYGKGDYKDSNKSRGSDSKFDKPKSASLSRSKKTFDKPYDKKDAKNRGEYRDAGKVRDADSNFDKPKSASLSRSKKTFDKPYNKIDTKRSGEYRDAGKVRDADSKFEKPKSTSFVKPKKTDDKSFEKPEKKSSFKDFRSKGDKIKKLPPANRRTILSSEEKRKQDPESKVARTSKSTIKKENGADDYENDVKSDSKKTFKEAPEKKNNKEALPVAKADSKPKKLDDGKIRLNRYISNAGICSRRDADKIILEGSIKVNGEVITELGYKVNPSDSVKFGNKVLTREKSVYILLNKPKDFITTVDDPEERKTVMDLVKNACTERVYPVGRLDRNTTGLLLLTNDGELAATLTHPSFEVKKIYQVDLDKPLEEEHLAQIIEGVELEDGPVNVDDIEVVSEDRKIIGLEIHVGRNRIVRRLFEHLGYDVVQLDRVMYAGLTKKDLPRGKWRMLTAKEVIKLKHF